MKLRVLSMIALTSMILLDGASAGSAQRQGQRGAGANAAADLEAMVQVFEDQEGQKPIANGAKVFDKPFVWVRFAVSNQGLAKADKFTYKAVVYQNGSKTAAPAAETITLEPNQSQALPMVKINTAGASKQISTRIIADIGNFVKESDETNNKMEMSFKVANNF